MGHAWAQSEWCMKASCEAFLILAPSQEESHTAHSATSDTMQKHVCSASTQGSLLETQHPRFLLKTGHVGTLA